MKKMDITTDPADTKRLRDYYEQLYMQKFDILYKMD